MKTEHPNQDLSPHHAPDEAKLVDSHCIHAMKAEFPTLGLVLDLQVWQPKRLRHRPPRRQTAIHLVT